MGYSICDRYHINELGDEIVDISVKAGWVGEDRQEQRTFGDLMALLHSEVSEALEEFRNGYGHRYIYHKPESPTKPEGIPIELADVAIRLFYTAAIYEIDLEEAIRMKLAYNRTRLNRHAGPGVQGADGKRL